MINDSVIKSIDCNSGLLKFVEHVIGCSINQYNLEYLNNDYWFEDCIPSEF